MNPHQVTRRTFLGGAAASAFAFTILPGRARGANERVRVASIGIGGKGASDVSGVSGAGADIVALCDVDMRQTARKGQDAREAHPNAKFFRDFRVMLDEFESNFDAVTVSTPDHVHAHASVMAMRRKKHVYCQKPLSHSLWEARLMAETARETGVATQMGNQAHAGEPIRRAVELIRAGLIGKVREVHTWTNRPIWPQGMAERPEAKPVPDELAWDLWLGPVADREYSPDYVPFKWRGWWDFGTGALGDMGCHIMDMPFWALDLKSPTSVEAESAGNTALSGPTESTITYRFPAGKYCDDLTYTWYDGSRMPSEEVFSGVDLPRDRLAKQYDLIMIGDKGKFVFNRGNTNFLVLPEGRLAEFADTPETLPRVKDEDVEWIAACQGGPPALSNFANSGPLTEFVLLGNLAIRLGRRIEWDGPNLKAPGTPEADALIRREYRKGWEL